MKNLVISFILAIKILAFELCPEVQLGEYMYDLTTIKQEKAILATLHGGVISISPC